MSGQRGRDVLIKIGDGGQPESFVTLAGIRSSEMDLNQKAVDATSMESPDGWRELLAGAGVKSMRVRGRGLFKDSASDARMRAVFLAGELARYQLVIPAKPPCRSSCRAPGPSPLRWRHERGTRRSQYRN